MTYHADSDDSNPWPAHRARRRGAGPRRHAAHAKFSRLEALESRLLFNTGLDPTFGVGGRSRFDVANLADSATAVHRLPDGKILVAGSATWALDAQLNPIRRAFVARLNPDGSLDATFGEAGIANTLPPPEGEILPAVVYPHVTSVDALAVGPDGRIFVGGSTAATLVAGSATTPANPPDPSFAVAAFSADGVPDASFGQRGVAHFPVLTQPQGGEESVDAIAVQGDGTIIATGAVRRYGVEGSDLATVRFTAAGLPDLSFGAKLLRLDGDRAYTTTDAAVAMQADGKIVVMGKASLNQAANFALGRYHADGTPDSSFGNTGQVVTPVPVPAFAGADAPGGFCDVLVQPDGSIVAAAKTGYFEVTVVRYTAAGAVDQSFGGGDGLVEGRAHYGNAGDLWQDPADGSLLVAVANSFPVSYATATAGDVDGDPLTRTAVRPIAGLPRLSVMNPGGFSAYLARLDPAGQVVSEKRMAGSDTVGVENVYAVEIQPDGKLLAVGSAHPTAYNGEGAAWNQTADALAVRLDSVLFGAVVSSPITDPPDLVTVPPIVPTDPPATPVFEFFNGALTPTFSGSNTVAKGRSYRFKLHFQTAEQARSTPVGVFGPAAHLGQAKLLKVKVSKGGILSLDARPAMASYKVAAPGGKFDAGDNGQYAVRLGAADPAGQLVGQFTVAAPARRARTARELTGVLQSDLRRITGQAPNWRLERPGRAPLVLEITVPVEDAFAGQPVTVAGHYKTISTPQGGKAKVFVVTSIRAAAP